MSVDYQDFKIIFTVFLFWFSIQFGSIVEDSIAYILVLSLGIMHGANDLLILKRKEKNNLSFLKSIIGYFVLIVTCVLTYFVNPFISLLIFIVLSAYHFGEQHLERKINGPNWLRISFYLLYGLLIFLLIFQENLPDVNLIVHQLSNHYFTMSVLQGILVTVAVLLVTLALFAQAKKYITELNIYKELFSLVLLFFLFKSASLIFGFAIYFIFWHSIPSILDQTKYISGEVSTKGFMNYLKTASPIWVVSILALVVLYFYVDRMFFSSSIFMILFAVTAPHAWVMYRMKKLN